MPDDITPTQQSAGTETQTSPVSTQESQVSKGVSLWTKPPAGDTTKPSEAVKPTETKPAQQTQQPAQDTTGSVQTKDGTQVPVTQELRQEAQQRGMSVDEMAELIVKANQKAREQEQQAAASKPKGMTQEEFNKKFGVVQVDDATFGALFGFEATPEQTQMFNQLLHRTAGMAVKMAEHKYNEALAALRQELAPTLSTVGNIQAKTLETRFRAAYPELAPYEELVRQTAVDAKKAGMKFKTADEGFKFVADKVKTLLKSAGVQLQQKGGTTTPTQQQQPSNQRVAKPATPGFGGGAGARKSASAAPVSKGLSLFVK